MQSNLCPFKCCSSLSVEKRKKYIYLITERGRLSQFLVETIDKLLILIAKNSQYLWREEQGIEEGLYPSYTEQFMSF